jgi:hypothetical protein
LASTPLSNSTSYCTVAEFLKRNDARRVGELLNDIGERAEYEAILSGTALPDNSNVQACLDSAAGQLEAACLVGGRYKPADLAAMTGVSASFRDDLISSLAMQKLLRRRKAEAPNTEATKEALAHLKSLQNGDEILGMLEQEKAGIPSDTFETQQDIERRNLVTTQAARLFGQRGNTALHP